MNYCGIICEYNPLHNGHAYHIRETLKALSPDGIICVMSGNFMQRGEPAAADKYTRAKWAIAAGADIVLELPAVFALSPAENFAFGAVNILSAIKKVKYLSFGSEFGDINKLKEFAHSLQKENIRENLDSGQSYASSFSSCGYSANNILGAEYLKALEKLKSSIIPFTVKREGGAYSDNILCENFSSATAIRKCLAGGNKEFIKEQVPPYVYNSLTYDSEVYGRLFDIVCAAVLTSDKDFLESIYGVSEGLHNRIIRAIKCSYSYGELIENIRTKRYPESKIKRILLCLLLKITDAEVKTAKKSPPYARVLALRKGREDILSDISKDIKVISRASDYGFYKDTTLSKDILATEIYSKLTRDRKLCDLSAGLNIVKF